MPEAFRPTLPDFLTPRQTVMFHIYPAGIWGMSAQGVCRVSNVRREGLIMERNRPMAPSGTDNVDYRERLLSYYEDEIIGEAYFYRLASHFGGAGEREKLAQLADVEGRAAETVRPLLEIHGLVPRDVSVLIPLGEADAERHQRYNWADPMAYMAAKYPAYLEEFEELEHLAPEDDLPALKLLTHHEVVVIDFANKEIAGDPDSLTPIRQYLEQCTV